MTNTLILVTGATGTIGGEVVKQLVQGGHRVRALVRDPAKAPKFGPKVEVVTGDLAKPEILAAAFAGVDKTFVISPSTGPAFPELEGNAETTYRLLAAPRPPHRGRRLHARQ